MGSIPAHLFRPGYLDTDITIEVNRRTKQSGTKVDNWETFAEEYAMVNTSGGAEFYAARQVNATLTHEVLIRFRPGIKSSMRIRYMDYYENAEKYLYIDSVQPVEHNGHLLRMFCRQLNDGEWRASE